MPHLGVFFQITRFRIQKRPLSLQYFMKQVENREPISRYAALQNLLYEQTISAILFEKRRAIGIFSALAAASIVRKLWLLVLLVGELAQKMNAGSGRGNAPGKLLDFKLSFTYIRYIN